MAKNSKKMAKFKKEIKTRKNKRSKISKISTGNLLVGVSEGIIEEIPEEVFVEVPEEVEVPKTTNEQRSEFVESVKVDTLMFNKKVQNREERLKAEEAEYKRKSDVLEAIEKNERKMAQDDSEMEEFFKDVKKRVDDHLRKQEEASKMQDENLKTEKESAKKEINKSKKTKTQKAPKKQRMVGTSFEDILNSKEFNEAWENFEEER